MFHFGPKILGKSNQVWIPPVHREKNIGANQEAVPWVAPTGLVASKGGQEKSFVSQLR